MHGEQGEAEGSSETICESAQQQLASQMAHDGAVARTGTSNSCLNWRIERYIHRSGTSDPVCLADPLPAPCFFTAHGPCLRPQTPCPMHLISTTPAAPLHRQNISFAVSICAVNSSFASLLLYNCHLTTSVLPKFTFLPLPTAVPFIYPHKTLAP